MARISCQRLFQLSKTVPLSARSPTRFAESSASTVKSAPDAPRLRVEHLRAVFRLADGREAPAVDDVSFEIQPGETLGLVGESGSGKSVTALSIVRLVLPPGRVAGGRVELDGRNLLDLDERDMRAIRGRKIGFVFQEPMVAL